MRARSRSVFGPGGRRTVVTALAVGAAGITFATAGAPVAVRVLLALPLLFAPGYLLANLLFPDRNTNVGERAILVTGLAIAVTVLVGLLLNEFPAGLNRRTWAASLGSAALIAYVLGLVIHGKASDEPRPEPRSRVSLAALATVLVALLLVLAGLGIARKSALDAAHRSHFTELWALPIRTRGAPVGLRFGVANRERAARRYVLVVRTGSRRLETLSFRLGSGRSRTGRLRTGSLRSPVTVSLYLGTRAAGSPYRHVRLWLGG